MLAIIIKMVIGVILTLLFIVLGILGVYYILLLLSILTGLIGLDRVSIFFRGLVDSLSNRILKVKNILRGNK